MIYTSKNTSGFALPAVLIVSVALLIIGLSVLQSAISIQGSIRNQYYMKIAQEAAESGTMYAYACLESNSRIQTWGTPVGKPSLTQKTDCTGTNSFSYDSLLPSSATVKATFLVGDLVFRESGTLLISATGTATVTDGSGNTLKTLTYNAKKLVSWDSLVGEKSAAGSFRTCGIVSGSVYCWGQNTYGQLGDGTNTDSLIPVKVVRDAVGLGAKYVTDIGSGALHVCAIADSELYCWGLNSQGQLGTGNTTDSSTPKKVGGLLAGKTVTDVGTSKYATCAIANGELYCWGDNTYGQLGIGNNTDKSSPTKVIQDSGILLGKTVTELNTSGTNDDHSCAIAGGLAYCWGSNTSGQLGDGTTTARTKPVAVSTAGVLSGKTITALSADGFDNQPTATGNQSATCAVASGAVYCWGRNNNGKLGNNSSSNIVYSLPQAVSTSGVLSGKTVTEVTVGSAHACVIANGSVYCWGANNYGQVGVNTTTINYIIPTTVYQEPGVFQGEVLTNLGGGANRACATAAGKNYCWGYNNAGQIGDGTTDNAKKPTESVFLRPRPNVFIF